MAGKGKIVRGALEALTDLGRRDFVKGAAATGALTGLKLKWGKKIIDEIAPAASKVIPKLPESIFNLPSLKQAFEGDAYTDFIENLDMYDAADLREIIESAADDSILKNFGTNLKNIANLNAKQLENIVSSEKFTLDTGIHINSARFDPEDILRQDADEIKSWLRSGDIDPDIGTSADDVLIELRDEYKLSKEQIEKYLDESGIFDEIDF
jgi:hypothetical protein|tara:strand:+ start:55 stop:684 length:630 start_codon:yes stop_codon:yes gene_type:complete